MAIIIIADNDCNFSLTIFFFFLLCSFLSCVLCPYFLHRAWWFGEWYTLVGKLGLVVVLKEVVDWWELNWNGDWRGLLLVILQVYVE